MFGSRERRKGKNLELREGTFSIGTMTRKQEIWLTCCREGSWIYCVQKTRCKGSKARSLGAGFKLYYYCIDGKINLRFPKSRNEKIFFPGTRINSLPSGFSTLKISCKIRC